MNNIEELKTKIWFRTFSGQVIDPENLKPENIKAVDIARSLSLQCRYAGQICRFYSVAEHSLLVKKLALDRVCNGTHSGVSESIRKDLSLRALLHDASEAYISDIPTPFKKLLPGYYELESKMMENILIRYNVKPDAYLDDLVKKADKDALDLEMPQLFNIPDHMEFCSCYDSNTAFSLYLNELLQYE